MREDLKKAAVFAGIGFLLFGAQHGRKNTYTDKTEEDTKKHVKNLRVSSLDRRLPRVTLEFFWQYEGKERGSSGRWESAISEQGVLYPTTSGIPPFACRPRLISKTTVLQWLWFRWEKLEHNPPLLRRLSA
jgi:hypothetical protein